MFQMGGVGPMFGQLGHFHKFAADKITDDYPTNRYRNETKRLLGFPWVRVVDGFYGAGELVGINDFGHVNAWVARCEARPASKVGLDTPSRG